MPTSYSTDLKLSLMATGENDTTWGDITNTNLGTLLEQSIVRKATVAMADATTTISISNGATSEARCYVLNLTGALTAQRNLVVPTIDKPYIINNTTTGGFGVQVKTTAGTGIVVPNGMKRMVFADSTDVVEAITNTGALTVSGALIGTSSVTADTGNFTTSITTATAIATSVNATTVTATELESTLITLTATPAIIMTSADAPVSIIIEAVNNAQIAMEDHDGTTEINTTTAEFGGDITVTDVCTAASYVTSSDYRLKRDVHPLQGATDKLMALRALSYMREGDDMRTDGFMAHEVAEVLPHAVLGEKDGPKMQRMDYMRVIPLLTAALQEAMERIRKLEAR